MKSLTRNSEESRHVFFLIMKVRKLNGYWNNLTDNVFKFKADIVFSVRNWNQVHDQKRQLCNSVGVYEKDANLHIKTREKLKKIKTYYVS